MKHDIKLNPFWKELDWLPSDYRNSVNKNILVINDVQHALQLALKNKVVFFTADNKVAKLFNGFVKDNSFYGKDDVVELIEEWKDLNKLKQILDKYNMFDLIVMNPPYDKSLHLKILEAVVPHAEKTVNISPIGYALDWPVMLNMKQTPNWKTKSFCMNHIVSCNMLDAHASNALFGIGSFEKLAICVFDNELHDVGMNLWKNDKRKSLSIFNKTIRLVHEKKIDNIAAHISISTIHGHPGCSDEFDVCTPQYDLLKNRKPADMAEAEFKNWHVSQNTKFMKYCNFLTRQGQHLQPRWLPFMQDYSQPWTDERFCEYFKITGYISDTEAVPGSEWETILNSVTKK